VVSSLNLLISLCTSAGEIVRLLLRFTERTVAAERSLCSPITGLNLKDQLLPADQSAHFFIKRIHAPVFTVVHR
jgi:hypothetical protein